MKSPEDKTREADDKYNKSRIFRVCLYVVILLLVIEVLISLSVHKKTYYVLQRMRIVQEGASIISDKFKIINRMLDGVTASSPTTDDETIIANLSHMEFYFQKCDFLVKLNITLENQYRFGDFGNCSQLCPMTPPKLVGALATYTDAPSFNELESTYAMLTPGGRYSPTNCIPRHRVAIIIPYRNREMHLRTFLRNIHVFLQRQQLEYGIFVVEQAEGSRFNRAMLMNIGYAEAIKFHNYSCFIFHDVDLIPENDHNIYGCFGNPRHMSAAVDKFNYRLPYNAIFGGVSAISRENFEKVNGFSNMYFGWGGEDDDMWNRLHHYGLKVVRYPMAIARYRMIRHGTDKGNKANGQRMKLLHEGRKRFKTDGINSLKYTRLKVESKKLYTFIQVKIDEQEIMKNWKT